VRFRFTQYLVAMRTAQRFLEEHDAQLGKVNLSGTRQAFDACITRLATLAEAQGVYRAGSTNHRAEEKRLLRRFSRQELQPLLTVARAVAQIAEAHKQLYIDLGFAPDFLDHFRGAADALVQKVADKGSSRVSRQQTTQEIEQVVVEARRTLRVLDALVERAIDDRESPVRTGWQAAMAVVARRAPAALPGDTAPDAQALKAA
jgi:hypothetical protein